MKSQALYLTIACLFLSALALAQPIVITSSAVPLNPADAAQSRLGQLTYGGGLHLQSADRRFGGWSGLVVSNQGNKMVAVSDRGYWLYSAIHYTAQGEPAALVDARMGALLHTTGKPAEKFDADAEEITQLKGGDWLISFEHNHRIARFSTSLENAVPTVITTPPQLKKAAPNGGIEAMTTLENGQLLTLVENSGKHAKTTTGYLINPETGAFKKLQYAHKPGFKPVGLCRLSNGDIAILERRFRGAGRLFWVRVGLISKETIKERKIIKSEELALIDSRLSSDNFEGISTRRTKAGREILYLVSDNNYDRYQRTLFMQFFIDRTRTTRM